VNLSLHEKSCMLDSLCIVLDINPQYAVKFIGHDGKERGFHSQELIDLADNLGYATTEIQRFPRGVNPNTYETVNINFTEGNEERFVNHLRHEAGIIMGMKLGRPHAVAWLKDHYIDPANGMDYKLIQHRELAIGIFDPMVFLRLNRYE